MMSEPPVNELTSELFRFARVLAEDEEKAVEAVAKALEQCRSKHASVGSARFRRLAFSSVRMHLVPRYERNQSPDRKPVYANGIAEGAVEVARGLPVETVFEELRRLAEPGRSALVLLYLGIFDVSDLESILHTTGGELSVALMLAREDLSMALQRRGAVA